MDEPEAAWHLFEVTGIELEYMIVDRGSLAVRPIADEVIRKVVGRYEMSAEFGPIAWSNELALHVIELKTNGPTDDLTTALPLFQEHVGRVNDLLKDEGAVLMPGPMHPLMDPDRELRLWPHEDSPIYTMFDRIFDCRGHGWANLQSTHINLPFAGEDEFGRLHAAVRFLLPVLPALTAASPVVDGRLSGLLDTRLDVYRHNSDRVPSVAGMIVPERAYTREEYDAAILQPIYRDLEPLDPDGIIRHHWVNARGCIAHFDRGSVEIRVLDIQESPRADLAVIAAIVAVLKALTAGELTDPVEQRRWHERELATILLDVIRDGDRTRIRNREYLAALGCRQAGPITAADLWRHLIDRTLVTDPDYDALWREPLELILTRGCLARRLEAALGADPDTARIRSVYGELVTCLGAGELFRPVSPS